RRGNDRQAISYGEDIHEHDDATARFAGLRGDRVFDPGNIIDRRNDRLHRKGSRSRIERSNETAGKGGCGGIEDDRGAPDVRHDVPQDVQPFPTDPELEVRESSRIAARVSETGDKTASEWVGKVCEHDWGRTGFL